MGIFDLEISESDKPTVLGLADEKHPLILITTQARIFRLRFERLDENPARAKGIALSDLFPLHPDEQVVCALPEMAGKEVAVLTERGHVRKFRANYFGPNLRLGLILYNISQLGPPTDACWTDGDSTGGLFIATRQGRGIRFAEKLVPVRGCLGIRLNPNDQAVAITPVMEKSGVFIMSGDGKGTIRLMSGFAESKTAGSSGKAVMKTDDLIGTVTVSDEDDIFMISRLSKIIRFQVASVPFKEGLVQGANCMALCADEVTALIRSQGH